MSQIDLLELPIEDLRVNPKNPRLIKDEKFKQLKKSLKEFPEMLRLRPLIIDKNNMILGGNKRYEAAVAIKRKTVFCLRADKLTEAQKRQFIVKDNLSYGDWDWSALMQDWNAAELMDWGLDIPAFAMDVSNAQEDEFEIPDVINTDIVIGDYFEIGPHRLLCGDSTKEETFRTLFSGQTADMVLTDPPYNVNYEGATKKKLKIKNDNMSDDKFYQFLYNFYASQYGYAKPGSAWYIWHADTEGANFRRAMADAGLLVKQCLIWVKNQLVMGRQDYQWQHEPCLYGWRSGASHAWYNDRKQTTVLNFDKPSRNEDHPTMKPVKLFAYQIANSSKSGDIVADAFGGSGTTMVASHQLNRKAYVVEFDPKYCQVIIDRMQLLDPSIKVKRNGKRYVKAVA